MSVLTVKEITLLKSLECRDKVQAVSVLEDILPLLPVRSEMFKTALALSYKLKNLNVDYEFEMAREDVESKDF